MSPSTFFKIRVIHLIKKVQWFVYSFYTPRGFYNPLFKKEVDPSKANILHRAIITHAYYGRYEIGLVVAAPLKIPFNYDTELRVLIEMASFSGKTVTRIVGDRFSVWKSMAENGFTKTREKPRPSGRGWIARHRRFLSF